MNMKVACAPCCWGVEPSELSVNPSWGRILVEAREAGYEGIELGPIGYFPDDPELLKSALRVRGLRACAGNLHEASVIRLHVSELWKKRKKKCDDSLLLGSTSY